MLLSFWRPVPGTRCWGLRVAFALAKTGAALSTILLESDILDAAAAAAMTIELAHRPPSERDILI